MNLFLVYLLLLKATLTSFSGLAGLPIVRQDFVIQHHLITDAQLNQAVAVGRTVPGPNGLYIACAGYYAAGIPGAIAGTAAMITPAFLIIPLLRWAGRHAGNRRAKGVISAVLLASAALLIATSVELARVAIHDSFSATLALVSVGLMSATTIDTLWVMLAAATLGLMRRLF